MQLQLSSPDHASTETMEGGCQPALVCAKFGDLSRPPVQEVSSLIKSSYDTKSHDKRISFHISIDRLDSSREFSIRAVVQRKRGHVTTGFSFCFAFGDHGEKSYAKVGKDVRRGCSFIVDRTSGRVYLESLSEALRVCRAAQGCARLFPQHRQLTKYSHSTGQSDCKSMIPCLVTRSGTAWTLLM